MINYYVNFMTTSLRRPEWMQNDEEDMLKAVVFFFR